MRNQGFGKPHRQQRGAVLIVALLILLVLTMLGVVGLSNMTLEERMAAGYQQMETTFDASQSVINTVVFNSTQFSGNTDCETAGTCTTTYNRAIDPTNILDKGLSDGRNIPIDANNCNFSHTDATISQVGTGTLSNASLAATAWVTTAGKSGGLQEMPGFEVGNGLVVQRYDITAETQYQSAGVTTAVSSQTQRIVKIVPGEPADAACLVNFSERTYPILR